MSRISPDRRKPPENDPDKPRPSRVTRQRRDRLNRDAEYLVMRDIYLEENPLCAGCAKPADQVHHIVGGAAGRARSLLNSDTWLGVCGDCHDYIGRLPTDHQIAIKQIAVNRTINRLRK